MATPSRVRLPLAMFSGTGVVLFVVHLLSDHLSDTPAHEWLHWAGSDAYLDGRQQFDGHHYLDIAADGYSYRPGVQSTVVWFPLYPLLIRWTSAVIGDPLLSGVLIGALCGALCAVLSWRWLGDRGVDGAARFVAYGVLFLFPYSYYLYGVVYADATFLALVLAAWLLVESGRPAWAGLAGALATATRPQGLALVLPLVVLALERDGVLVVAEDARGRVRRWAVPLRLHRDRLRLRHAAPLLSFAGIGAYVVYLWRAFDAPLAFWTNQGTYQPGDLPWLKRAVVVAWLRNDDLLHPITLTLQGLIVLAVLVATPFVGRRFGWGYALFGALLAAMPLLSSADFMGSGRYLLAAFPVAALWGERLAERPRLAVAWLAASALLLLVADFGFSRSWYLA